MQPRLLPPVSVQLSPDQMQWLDSRRQHGAISRSAALRQAIDTLRLQQQHAQPKD
jgi:metal-responsive CopG/Arc/MetJ family transcriptional regulator